MADIGQDVRESGIVTTETIEVAAWAPRVPQIDIHMTEFRKCFRWLTATVDGSADYLRVLSWFCLISRYIILKMVRTPVPPKQCEDCMKMFSDAYERTNYTAASMGEPAKTYARKLDERADSIRLALRSGEFLD